MSLHTYTWSILVARIKLIIVMHVYVVISGPVSYRDAELARIIINQGGVDPLAFGSSLLYKCKNMQQK
jgi:hypothetical protein